MKLHTCPDCNQSSVLITSLPLYVPHALHTLCARLYSPHLGHFVMPGRSSFQTLERLLSLLALETFSSVLPCLMTSYIIFLICCLAYLLIKKRFEYCKSRVSLRLLQPQSPSFKFFRIADKDRDNPLGRGFSTAFQGASPRKAAPLYRVSYLPENVIVVIL